MTDHLPHHARARGLGREGKRPRAGSSTFSRGEGWLLRAATTSAQISLRRDNLESQMAMGS
jgi:hypothetical protein